ncbi:MAG: glutamate racemase [Muribaculaceae bacterium]|nr:glutamate racemase [Muribaculaceae bacterium]
MKIGVFDSGYGGLTILREIINHLPEYDYIYLGDNARAPYGSRSFDIVYQYTLQAVKHLFELDCQLVILACNTASAKALRTIQQCDLPVIDPTRRVLGVIIPTVEELSRISSNRHIGIMATQGTIDSHSYSIETHKLNPDMRVTEMACPMWVPLIENNEIDNPGADYFIQKYCKQILEMDPEIDTLVLGCTHYPLLYDKIADCMPDNVRIIAQGDIVARSLSDYLRRHPEIENKISRGGNLQFLTSESPAKFNRLASLFLPFDVKAERIYL